MTSQMEILPAIDLRGGRVVRLRQGDFARETTYSDDPAAVARSFAEAGARWLHVVDLDGARSGTPSHREAIAAIVRAVPAGTRVEVAGGLRTEDAVDEVLAAGASRVVVGTAALRDPSFAARLVARRGPDRVAAAIDVREGRASGDGWDAAAPTIDAFDAMARLAGAGITVFEVTAIDRDGLLQGPDLALLTQAVALGVGDVIASAGIGSIEDIAAVRALGCTGAIVGRALYEGRLDLRDALAEAASA